MWCTYLGLVLAGHHITEVMTPSSCYHRMNYLWVFTLWATVRTLRLQIVVSLPWWWFLSCALFQCGVSTLPLNVLLLAGLVWYCTKYVVRMCGNSVGQLDCLINWNKHGPPWKNNVNSQEATMFSSLIDLLWLLGHNIPNKHFKWYRYTPINTLIP